MGHLLGRNVSMGQDECQKFAEKLLLKDFTISEGGAKRLAKLANIMSENPDIVN